MEFNKINLAMVMIIGVVAFFGATQTGLLENGATGFAIKLDKSQYVIPDLQIGLDTTMERYESGDRGFYAETLMPVKEGRITDILFHEWKHGRIVKTLSAKEEGILVRTLHRATDIGSFGYVYNANFIIKGFEFTRHDGVVYTAQVLQTSEAVSNHIRFTNYKNFRETSGIAIDQSQRGLYTDRDDYNQIMLNRQD